MHVARNCWGIYWGVLLLLGFEGWSEGRKKEEVREGIGKQRVDCIKRLADRRGDGILFEKDLSYAFLFRSLLPVVQEDRYPSPIAERVILSSLSLFRKACSAAAVQLLYSMLCSKRRVQQQSGMGSSKFPEGKAITAFSLLLPGDPVLLPPLLLLSSSSVDVESQSRCDCCVVNVLRRRQTTAVASGETFRQTDGK